MVMMKVAKPKAKAVSKAAKKPVKRKAVVKVEKVREGYNPIPDRVSKPDTPPAPPMASRVLRRMSQR